MDMRIEMINLKELFEVQRDVDTKIREMKGVQGDTVDLKIIAFKVEFGEFLNEQQFFKFWKLRKVKHYALIMDEFADCIAFMLGIALERKWDEHLKNLNVVDKGVVTLPNLAIDIFHNPLSSAGQWYKCLVDLLQLAYSVGLHKEEIETAYLKKSQINVGRQENGY